MRKYLQKKFQLCLSETTRFPKNMMLGAIEDLRLIEAYGAEVGRQCREMGIHINFAPTIDVNSNTNNPVIGLRSFGEAPDAVSPSGYRPGIRSQCLPSVSLTSASCTETLSFSDRRQTVFLAP